MSRNRDRGKAYERFIAADLGGRRVGTMGKEDVILDGYSCELKERKKLPEFMKKCMYQAINNCSDGNEPLVFLHELYMPHSLDVVMMPYSVFRHMYQSMKGDEK